MLAVLLRKEFRQIWRNSYLRRLIFLYPISIALLSPLVTTLDVKDLGVAVVDNDHSELSMRMVADVNNSPDMRTDRTYSSYEYALHDLEAGRIDVVAEIPAGFERQLVQGYRAKTIGLTGNAVNSVKGSLGSSYVAETLKGTVCGWTAEHGKKCLSEPVEIVSTYKYNETLDYKRYMIPALLSIIILMIGGFLPALNMLSERVDGTIEQINASPVSPGMFMLGKMVPFWIIGVVEIFIAILMSRIAFGTTPAGSLGAVLLSVVLFTVFMTSLGCIVANLCKNMVQAMLVILSLELLFQLMGGLMTPIDSMPDWAQTMTMLLPSRYIIEILRAVFLKGSGVIELLPSYIALGVFCVVGIVLSFVTYTKRA